MSDPIREHRALVETVELMDDFLEWFQMPSSLEKLEEFEAWRKLKDVAPRKEGEG